MVVQLLTHEGKAYNMPPCTRWRVLLTGGVPCDEMEVRCPYDAETVDILPLVSRFAVYEGEKTVLVGVVDEYEVAVDSAGRELRVSGRGLAALLLDNEAEAVSYQEATLDEILRRHVQPYGISCCQESTAVGKGVYEVRSGESQWSAVSDFVRAAGGFEPHMTATGELVIAPLSGSGEEKLINSLCAVLSCTLRERRYGVLSEILVKNKAGGGSVRMVNEAFRARGGCRAQVLYMPGKSGCRAMRYTGNYQIEQSQKGAKQVEITLAGAFQAAPGDGIRLIYAPLKLNGSYDVVEAESRGGRGGTTTTLILEERG